MVDWGGVKNFSNATTHSFELWIRLSARRLGTGPASEEITTRTARTYLPGDGPGLGNAGRRSGLGIELGRREPRRHEREEHLRPRPPNGSEYCQHSPPTAGGSATITYDASSRQAGTYKSVASMTSNVTPGTTQEVETLTVTP